jgi:hypothetical protein
MAGFASPVVVEVDGKAFEAHVAVEQLQAEHSVYLRAFKGCPTLARLLGKQLVNRGRTPSGWKFKRPGGRASGDVNTGMGNTIIMIGLVEAVMRLICRRFDSLVDGDNALLFVEAEDLPALQGKFPGLALHHCGHEITIERPVRALEEVRFGQSAPVRLPGGLQLVRDWRKVISHATSSHSHMHHSAEVAPFLAGIALCEYSLAQGVPILGKYFYQLFLDCQARTGKVSKAQHYRDYMAMGVDVGSVLRREPVWVEPTESSRLSFESAFDVSPDLQLAIERALPRLGGTTMPGVQPGRHHVDWTDVAF